MTKKQRNESPRRSRIDFKLIAPEAHMPPLSFKSHQCCLWRSKTLPWKTGTFLVKVSRKCLRSPDKTGIKFIRSSSSLLSFSFYAKNRTIKYGFTRGTLQLLRVCSWCQNIALRFWLWNSALLKLEELISNSRLTGRWARACPENRNLRLPSF